MVGSLRGAARVNADEVRTNITPYKAQCRRGRGEGPFSELRWPTLACTALNASSEPRRCRIYVTTIKYSPTWSAPSSAVYCRRCGLVLATVVVVRRRHQKNLTTSLGSSRAHFVPGRSEPKAGELGRCACSAWHRCPRRRWRFNLLTDSPIMLRSDYT